MKYNLSKFVGRNQLPGDEAAFSRLAKIFGEESPDVINCCRRKRVPVPGHIARKLGLFNCTKPAD